MKKKVTKNMWDKQLCSRFKFTYINNHTECKWSKYSNGKKLSDWIKKTILNIKTNQAKIKRVKKTYHAHTNIRKSRVAVLISKWISEKRILVEAKEATS